MPKKASFQKTVLCWCGSGLRYSKCHRDRDKQIPLKSYEIDAEFRKAFSKKYCLHPQSSSSVCSQYIVKAHSVSVSSNLKNIAENGHVLRFYFRPKAPVEARKRMTAQSIGVNKASTFTGFCKVHDSLTFACIDKPVGLLTPKHYFLLAYRALSQGSLPKRHRSPRPQLFVNLIGGLPFMLSRRIKSSVPIENWVSWPASTIYIERKPNSIDIS